MSHADDEFFMHHEEGPDDHYDEEGRIKCKFCGSGNLEWDKHHHDTTGKWRLWEGEWPTGRPHYCNVRPADEDFTVVEAP